MSNEEPSKTDDGQSRLTVGLGIADGLRGWIPDGDGYNSEYANTLMAAAETMELLAAAVVAMAEDGWLYHGPDGMNEAQEKCYAAYLRINPPND